MMDSARKGWRRLSDLIDRKAAIDALNSCISNMGGRFNGKTAIYKAIMDVPTIDKEYLDVENDESVVLLLKPFHGMVEAECSGCGASIYVHPDFVERHRYCFCCGKKIEETVEAIDFDENFNQEEI